MDHDIGFGVFYSEKGSKHSKDLEEKVRIYCESFFFGSFNSTKPSQGATKRNFVEDKCRFWLIVLNDALRC